MVTVATESDDCSWQERYDKPRQCVEKQRRYSANKGIVKAMVFPAVMYGCESWTIKKAKCQRIDAFEPWCWRRLLRIPWKARRSNQSILRNLSTHWKDWCWSSSTLVTWCKQPTHWKSLWWCERLRAEEKGGRGWDGWMASPMQWTWT